MVVCKRFDDVTDQLSAGGQSRAERLHAAEACLEEVHRALQYGVDVVNLSTFMHRVSRLATHPAIASVRRELDASLQPLMESMLKELEGLLDEILEADRQARDRVGGAGPASSGAPPSAQSLSNCIWALCNLRHPLTRLQMEKITGVVMVLYPSLEPVQLSIFIQALSIYGKTPLEARLLQLLLERLAHFPIADIEEKTLLTTLSAAAAARLAPSQALMDRLALAALACLPEVPPVQLGNLAWALGKLGARLGAQRLHPPVLDGLTASAWRQLGDLPPEALSHVLYGLALLGFHPGEQFLDAASARLRDLLPELSPARLCNLVWAFARWDYSPAADRDLWAMSNESQARVSFRGWLAAGAGASAGGAKARPPRERDWAADAAQSAASQEYAVTSLAQRIITQRAQRDALRQLAAHAHSAMAASLARARGARRSDAPQAASPGRGEAGQAVDERYIGDLVQYICTGGVPYKPQPRVVTPAEGGAAGFRAHLDRLTGITRLQPYYKREQLGEVLAWTQRVWQQGPSAAEASSEGEGGTARVEAAQPDPVAAVESSEDELERLSAYLAGREDKEAGEGGGGGGQGAAEGLLEDPELEEGSDGTAQGGDGAGAAARLGSDLDPVGQRDLNGAEGREEGEEEEHSRQRGAAPPASTEQTNEATASQNGEAAAARAKARRARRQGQAASVAAAAAARAWRQLDLPPDQLLDHILQDGQRFAVPQEAKQRWRGAPRATLDDAAERLAALAPRMTPPELGTTLWSFATLRHVHPGLVQALMDRAERLLDDLNWRSIAIVMWSCAVMRQAPRRDLAEGLTDRYLPLFRRKLAADAASSKNAAVDLHSLCNVAWALAVFDYLTPERFSELTAVVPAHSEATLDEVATAAWCQFFQCALYLEAKTGQHYSSFLPPHMCQRAEQHWQSRDTTTSRLQNKVADVLHGMGVVFAEEYSPRAGFFSIDIAIEGSNGVKLAVEVDGPQHFSVSAPHMPLASTYLRNRLLEMHGWQVVSIPFNIWAELGDRKEKEEYLTQHVLSKLGGG